MVRSASSDKWKAPLVEYCGSLFTLFLIDVCGTDLKEAGEINNISVLN